MLQKKMKYYNGNKALKKGTKRNKKGLKNA